MSTVGPITEQILNEIHNDPEFQEKLERQILLEEKMRTMGIDRYWSNVKRNAEKGHETNNRPVRRLLNFVIDEVTKGIERFLEEAKSGKAGRRHAAVKFLSKLEPETVAFITARVVLDRITVSNEPFVSIARHVGTLIMDEINFRQFKAADSEKYNRLREKYEKQTRHYQHKRNAMKHHIREDGIEVEEWPIQDLIHVGAKCIEIFIASTGLVKLVTRTSDANKLETVLVPTEETMEWIQEEHNRCAVLSPVLLPTIVPPKPWTSPTSGGYWSGRVRRLTLVKTHSRAYLDELAEHEMPDVYDAINAMQHTAWAINTRVLDVARTLWNSKSTLAVIPSADPLPLPERPWFATEIPKDEWTSEQMQQFRDWKRAATDIYTMNEKLKSLRLQFVKTLMVAEMFENEEAIYFPHQLDFRGRAYAVPMFLNPQGADLARGLLEFANGVPINDEESRAWLAIHGANCWGYDKVSFEDRVRWVEENEQAILAVAADPYNNKWWADADKSWQFLAFCFEWADFVREGYGFISTLPVQIDGSCNGLQNFSAALRDPVGGEAVNLIPGDVPQDIYQRVADVVIERVRHDACNHEDDRIMKIAQGWLEFGITRKVCKRPVMTLAYGAKEYGFKRQVFEDTVLPAKLDKSKPFPWEGSGWWAADYMGRVIWECVGQVVVAARSAMDWFQKAARAASAENLPIRWTTPDGLVVLQAYPKLIIKRIKLTFNGGVIYQNATVGVDTELDRNRQTNGISPNWVHSMDASHMRATVRACWHDGMRSFSLIHDSYGTHAGNTAVLAEILREQFVEMYSQDVLQSFKEELEMQLPEGKKLPPLPPKGTLDLELVKQSKYFFA